MRLPVRYPLAIFDFDGTLADSFAFFVTSFDTLARRHGFRSVTAAEIPVLRRLGAQAGMRHMGIPARKLPVLARDFIGLMRERRDAIHPFPGVADMVGGLADAGVQVAVVSSNAEDNVAAVLGPDTMRRIRTGAYGMSMFGKRAHLRKVLKASGVRPLEAIFIGDQASDIAAALAEGMAAGAVAWGWGDVAHLEAAGAHHIFRNVEDITRLVAAPGA